MPIVAVHRPEIRATVLPIIAEATVHPLLHEAAIPAEAAAHVHLMVAEVEVPVRLVAVAEAVAGVAEDNACLI